MSRRLSESREYLRLDRSFEVNLHKVGVQASFAGCTDNISQGGAFVRTNECGAFRKDDQVLLTFYLTPEFTGQDFPIRLLGTASIIRIDEGGKGLGVKFNKALRQFERIELVRVDG